MESRVALTPRETQLVRLVMAGKTGREIAAELGVAVETVKAYSRQVRGKIGARNKVEVTLWGMKHLGEGRCGH